MDAKVVYEPIDWRELMKSYMQRVESLEGVHFLAMNGPVDEPWATEAENNALTELRDEAFPDDAIPHPRLSAAS